MGSGCLDGEEPRLQSIGPGFSVVNSRFVASDSRNGRIVGTLRGLYETFLGLILLRSPKWLTLFGIHDAERYEVEIGLVGSLRK